MYASESLASAHQLTQFDCGRPELDSRLRNHALSAHARRTGRTFVWHEDQHVVGYYTIAAHLIARDDLPRSVGHGSPRHIPAALLARLALDRTLHGHGFGGALLADALGRIVEASAVVAARFVVVDAIDEEAARFYQHHGFRRIPGTARLVQKTNDIAAALHD